MGHVGPSKLLCKDCERWYGSEDDEYGPCQYKHLRKEKKYITYGYHMCDEPEELKRRHELWESRRSKQ